MGTAETSAETKDMFQKIISAPDAFFRHQQKSEPDLENPEKLQILSELFKSQPRLFLSRYYKYLSFEDVPVFSNMEQEADFEISYYLKEIAKNRNVNAKTAKNRRYSALQKLISEEEFFSDWEMRAREPLLYDQMIGQFQTSEECAEALHSEAGGHAGLTFSSILMDFCQTKSVKEEKERQQQAEDEDGNFDGNFCEENGPADSSENGSKNLDGDLKNEKKAEKATVKEMRALKLEKRKKKLSEIDDLSDEEMEEDSNDEEEDEEEEGQQIPQISPAEKLRLRDEFVSLMHERFLSGADADFFDYKSVDENPDFDPMDIINRDAQDKYFDSEEPS